MPFNYGAVNSRLETLEKFKPVCFKGAQGDFCANYFLHKEMSCTFVKFQ